MNIGVLKQNRMTQIYIKMFLHFKGGKFCFFGTASQRPLVSIYMCLTYYTSTICLLISYSSFHFFFSFILQPYFYRRGQLVRPALQDSGDVQRPESSRTTQNTLSPDPGIPVNQVQPRGSESEDKDEQDSDYITYVVREKMTSL